MLLDIHYGLNRVCGGDLISVGFWQQGPVLKHERQGYVCGGFLSPAKVHEVPFEFGTIVDFDV